MDANSQGHGLTPSVLIVEDSLTVRMDLRETFESAGLANTACGTLAEAREALAGHLYSLVVLDVLLPDGDGLDLLREIKSTPELTLPVMLLSSEAEVHDRAKGLKIGADDYVGKPYDHNYVLARARQLIGSEQDIFENPLPSILLIDGNKRFLGEFKHILEGAGYLVHTATSGEGGLNKAFALRPNAIIVDGLLPGGISGNTVIHRLKQDVTLQNTPCLLLAHSCEADEVLRALENGADACLTKGTAIEIVFAQVAALLRSGSASRAVKSPASSLLGANRILAVDDSITFLNEVCEQLRQDGYDVIAARSGEEALELLEVQAVNCILLDVHMPGLSGYETCRIVKNRPDLRNIPVLMWTASGEPEDAIEGLNSGADNFVRKSSNFALLKARVRVQLRRKQFEDQDRAIREELLHKELLAVEARAAQEIAEARAAMVDGLEQKNRELEAFAYSVSHDLRAPLRTVHGFTQSLLSDFGDQFPPEARDQLDRVLAAASRMSKLIDTLLELSRTNRADLRREPFDLSLLAGSVAAELAESDPTRRVDCSIQPGLTARGDEALIRVVLNNLLGNAWKFTLKKGHGKIEVGGVNRSGTAIYFVRDNGAGFDSTRAQKLFQPFERLHAASDFPGTGLGLATVRRIIERHHGQIWAESTTGEGATFFFTLEGPGSSHNDSSNR